MSRSVAVPATRSAAGLQSYITLTKPRISLMVTLTGAVGYLLGSGQVMNGWGLLHVMVGTSLVAGAANALNQILERTPDALMQRTAKRPLPSGRIQTRHAVWFATVLGASGVLYLGLTLNLLTALLAFATLTSYAFVYTPLKRRTTLNTLVGAVPGALPPLGGWAAASGSVTWGGLALFLIVFLWQIPHFLSIAWLLRKEYERAGFRMLPIYDPMGRKTGIHMAAFGLALLPAVAVPYALHTAGMGYLIAALVLSALYAGVSLQAARHLTAARNRTVFLVSLVYLPALLVAMVLDKASV